MRSSLRLRERHGIRRALGAAGVVFFLVHAAHHLAAGEPENIAWACNLGALAVGAGLIAGWADAVAIGFLWLTLGAPLWILDVLTRGGFSRTTLLTHAGGIVLGVIGLKAVGLPRGAWWKAVVALALLHILSRWITPESANVNLAFSIWLGWKEYFPSHLVYILALTALCVGVFAGVQLALRKAGFEEPHREGRAER